MFPHSTKLISRLNKIIKIAKTLFFVVVFWQTYPRPVISGKELIRFLKRNGYYLDRVKGSHHHFKRNDGTGHRVSFNVHDNEDMDPDVLDDVIKYYSMNEGMTVDEVRQAIHDM